MNILIVDDNDSNRKVLKHTLKSEGFDSVEAMDGVQGLEVLEQGHIDAIISDVLMPIMDGYHFCQAVRDNPKFKDLPFLFYTSTCLTPSDEKLAKAVGADRYIVKPAPGSVLKDILTQLIGTKNRKETIATSRLGAEHIYKEYNQILVRKLEEKNAELENQNKKLQEAQEKFQELILNIDQVFYITSNQYQVMDYVSPAYERIWGRSCQSLYENPSSWMEAVHPEDRGRVEQELKNALPGSAQTLDYRLVRPDGTIRWIRARLFPVLGNADKSRVVGLAEDVTDFVKINEEKDVLESKFLQAQKMEAIGQLAGGVAHDFNNLLSVIIGYSDFILKEDSGAPKTVVSDVQEIKEAAIRASTLTRQLLAFSRRQILQPSVLNLNDSVLGLEKMLCRLIGENIELISELHPKLDLVKVDPGQIEQVIMNLVVNSRDAMPTGGKLKIKTENIELKGPVRERDFEIQPGRYVKLIISDTGMGMDAQTKLRIFEPFFTTKEKGKGTGLGLSTVFGIIKQSGGYIQVESRPGKGTAFYIYLPQVEGRLEKLRVIKPEASTPARGETILVVEDDDKIRSMIKRILEPKSYNVLEASNGEDALAFFEKDKEAIHILLTDILMPGMTGIELASQVEAKGLETKILYMSGYTDQATFLEEIPKLQTNFLTKPFTPDVLIVKIREVLDADRQ